jgi:hypothetical protein
MVLYQEVNSTFWFQNKFLVILFQFNFCLFFKLLANLFGAVHKVCLAAFLWRGPIPSPRRLSLFVFSSAMANYKFLNPPHRITSFVNSPKTDFKENNCCCFFHTNCPNSFWRLFRVKWLLTNIEVAFALSELHCYSFLMNSYFRKTQEIL